jgi:hypothetical protein
MDHYRRFGDVAATSVIALISEVEAISKNLRKMSKKPDFSGFSSAGFAAVIRRPLRHRPA